MSSTHCFLRTDDRSICHGSYNASSEFLNSHTFRRKRNISIARTGNVIMYVLGPFSRKGFQLLCSFIFKLATVR